MIGSKHWWSIAVAAIGFAANSRAHACAACIEIPGTIGAVHPQSIAVAIAIRKQLEAGSLTTVSQPSPDSAGADLRPGLRMRMFFGRIHREPGDLEILIIDKGTRFRIGSGGRGFFPVLPGKKYPPPSVRWVTGKDVLHALVERRITVDSASKSGILWVENVPR